MALAKGSRWKAIVSRGCCGLSALVYISLTLNTESNSQISLTAPML